MLPLPSYGDRRIVNVLTALHGPSKLIFLDEPSNGLDPLRRKVLDQYINEVKRSLGKTLIIASHRLAYTYIFNICLFHNILSVACNNIYTLLLVFIYLSI